jgi:tetratricopeptide (TPR) repeat protein
MQKSAKISIIYLLFALLVIFTGCSGGGDLGDLDEISPDKEKAEQLFIKGKLAELKFNYFEALENYNAALKYDKSPGIYSALSNLYFDLGKYNESYSNIQKALSYDQNNINYLEQKANAYLGLDNLDKAAEVYENILARDSSYSYGLYTLARIYQELKQPSKAILIYEKITDRIGFDYDVLRRMYEIYYSYKEYEKCGDVLKAVLQLDPYDSEIIEQLAMLYIRQDKYQEAKDIYEELLRLNPNNKEMQTELVKIYFYQDETDKAFQKFGNLIGKDSLGFKEKLQVGELYYNQITKDANNIYIAKNIFSNLQNNYPSEWLPYYYLGAIYLEDDDLLMTREQFTRAIDVADTSLDAHVQIGLTYYNMGETLEAEKVLLEGLAVNRDDFRLNYLLGLTLQAQGRTADALSYYEIAAENNSQDINILSAMALAYNSIGKYEESDNAYEKALRIDPNNPLILNNYAYNLSERGAKLDKALEMAKIAIDVEPENASYLDTMGWIYFKLKKYKLAEKYILKSLNLNGGSAVVNDHLGDVYKGMGETGNAVIYWKKALELNPGDENIKNKISNNS